MSHTNQKIRIAYQRNAKAVELRPSIGRMTGSTKIRLPAGTRCEIDAGDWKLICDLPETSGGTNFGPDPGPLGRGALGACLALGYRTQAALAGVEVGAIEVEIEADFDAAGYYGISDTPPGYLGVRYHVSIESDAPESALRRIIDSADAHSPWLDVFARTISASRSLTFRSKDS